MGECDLSDIVPSGEIDVHLILLADGAVIRNKYVEYFIEAPTTAVGVL